MVAPAYTIEGDTAAGEGGERRPRLVAVGVVVLVVGLVTGVVLWVAAARRLDDSVRGLARAPVGCTTTLNFSETGDFLIFVESEGVLEEVRGDCAAAGEFRISGDEVPGVALTMVDPDGRPVELRLDGGVEYDAAGFVGRSERSVTVTTTGDHVLTVGSDDESAAGSFAVAIGKDPNDGVSALRVGAVLAALVGLVAGVAAIVLGNRRRPVTPTPGSGGWPSPVPGPPGPGWPGVATPPSGPPQGWPTTPPTLRPPSGGPPGPPTVPPAGPPLAPAPGPQWPGRHPGAPGTAAPRDPGRSPSPSPPPGSSDGSSGDGERSPWAPPREQ